MKNIPETPSLIVSYHSGERGVPEILRMILIEWLPEIFIYPQLLEEIKRYLYDGIPFKELLARGNPGNSELELSLLEKLPHTDPGLIDDLLTVVDGIKLVFEEFQLGSNEVLNDLLSQKKEQFNINLWD